MGAVALPVEEHPLVKAQASPQEPYLPEMSYPWKPARIVLHSHEIRIEAAKPLQTNTQVGGGIRSRIQGFTRRSRHSLMRTINRINTAQVGPMGFLTFTYHENWQERDVKRDLDLYFKRLRRRFPGLSYVWRLEYQRRGAPHFHVLIFFPTNQVLDIEDEALLADHWHQVVDEGNIHHAKHGTKVKIFEDSFEGVRIYTMKYCTKMKEGGTVTLEGYTGSYWGKSQNLPMAALDELVLDEGEEVEARRQIRNWLRKRPEEYARRSVEDPGECARRYAKKPGASARRYADTFVLGHNSQAWLKESETGFGRQMLEGIRRRRADMLPPHGAAHPLPFLPVLNVSFDDILPNSQIVCKGGQRPLTGHRRQRGYKKPQRARYNPKSDDGWLRRYREQNLLALTNQREGGGTRVASSQLARERREGSALALPLPLPLAWPLSSERRVEEC